MINVDKRQRAECLDTYWLEILFFLIGEHADQHAHQVNGAVVNVRAKGDKLAVWLADASQPDSILRIGKMIRRGWASTPSRPSASTFTTRRRPGRGVQPRRSSTCSATRLISRRERYFRVILDLPGY